MNGRALDALRAAFSAGAVAVAPGPGWVEWRDDLPILIEGGYAPGEAPNLARAWRAFLAEYARPTCEGCEDPQAPNVRRYLYEDVEGGCADAWWCSSCLDDLARLRQDVVRHCLSMPGAWPGEWVRIEAPRSPA